MTKQSEQVAHNELVGANQTSLHAHPGGGGGGLVDKGGTVTTGAQGTASVSFNTNYSDTNYFIGFSVIDPGDATFTMVQSGSKAVDGFDIKTWDDGGKAEPNVTVLWFTGPYSNP